MKKNNKGFTLSELLITVAITAVLVAVAIPVFSNKLESSREAVDVTNMRAAKAAAVAEYLAGDYNNKSVNWTTNGNVYTGGFTANFDAENGILTTSTPANYGKGTTVDGGTTDLGYQPTKSYSTYIQVSVSGDGIVSLSWAK